MLGWRDGERWAADGGVEQGEGAEGLVEGAGREGWEWGALGGWDTLGLASGVHWVWGW